MLQGSQAKALDLAARESLLRAALGSNMGGSENSGVGFVGIVTVLR